MDNTSSTHSFAKHSPGLQPGAEPYAARESLDRICLKWAALWEAARAVAAIAHAGSLEEMALLPGTLPFGAGIDRSTLSLAEQSVDDLTFLMATAVSALLETMELGGDPRGAATALLREFRAVDSALARLLPAGTSLDAR